LYLSTQYSLEWSVFLSSEHLRLDDFLSCKGCVEKLNNQIVEIKCQLDATEVFIADLIFAQHVSGTTMPIIRSSRVLYSGCCLLYLVL